VDPVRHLTGELGRLPRLLIGRIELRYGVGFRPDREASGIGLLSMRDRITSLGGELEIRSESGSDTRVHATVPLGSKA
jgi:glucose-6-phosphate-specific signal transduction histidine kinase